MSIVKLNNNGVKNATAFGSITGLGSMTFIKKLTASSSANLSFVHGSGGVDFSAYKEYYFTFKNIHPQTDEVFFTFNLSIDGGSNYNVAKTTTAFHAFNSSGSYGNETVVYYASADLAQGTGTQKLSGFSNSNENSSGLNATMNLFNPSSDTFVKHFILRTSSLTGGESYGEDTFIAGYANTASDIDAIQFSMSSGNIDAGDICLYGIN